MAWTHSSFLDPPHCDTFFPRELCHGVGHPHWDTIPQGIVSRLAPGELYRRDCPSHDTIPLGNWIALWGGLETARVPKPWSNRLGEDIILVLLGLVVLVNIGTYYNNKSPIMITILMNNNYRVAVYVALARIQFPGGVVSQWGGPRNDTIFLENCIVMEVAHATLQFPWGVVSQWGRSRKGECAQPWYNSLADLYCNGGGPSHDTIPLEGCIAVAVAQSMIQSLWGNVSQWKWPKPWYNLPGELYRNGGGLGRTSVPTLRYNSLGERIIIIIILIRKLSNLIFIMITYYDIHPYSNIDPHNAIVSWLGPPPLQYNPLREV